LNTKPRTTFKCRWVPRRSAKRTFEAGDVARIYCKARRDGVSEQEIEAQIEAKCPDKRIRQPKALEIAQQAVAVAEGNMTVLNDAYQLFFTINAVLLALLALPALLRRTPGLIVIFRAAAVAQRSVAAQVTVIGRQVAANESLYSNAVIALRRAA